MKFSIYILFGIFVLVGCTESEIPKYVLKSSINSSKLNPDLILAGVSSLEFDGDNFLITEYEHNRFYLLNKDFSIIDEFNNENKFGELGYPSFAKIGNGRYYLYQSGSKSILSGVGKDFKKLLEVESEVPILNFDTKDEYLLYSRVSFEKPPFVLFNQKTGKIVEFGKYLEGFGTTFQNYYLLNSYAFITDKGENLFVLPGLGKIYVFNNEFGMSKEIDLFSQSYLKNNKIVSDNFYLTTDNSVMNFISDCKILKDKLYILMYNRDENQKPNPQEIIVFDLDDEEVSAVYKIGGEDDYFTHFCFISEDRLAAYEYQSSSILVFDLK